MKGSSPRYDDLAFNLAKHDYFIQANTSAKRDDALALVQSVELALHPHVWKIACDSTGTIVKGANGKLFSACKRMRENDRGNKLDVLPVGGRDGRRGRH
jgi:hypothetical protein